MNALGEIVCPDKNEADHRPNLAFNDGVGSCGEVDN
jgi:hypothetical protein